MAKVLIMDKEVIQEVIKDVRAIGKSLDPEFALMYDSMSLDTLAFRLKVIAIDYDCVLRTRLFAADSALCKSYNIMEIDDRDDKTFMQIETESEPISIFFGFKWLNTMNYLVPEKRRDYEAAS